MRYNTFFDRVLARLQVNRFESVLDGLNALGDEWLESGREAFVNAINILILNGFINLPSEDERTLVFAVRCQECGCIVSPDGDRTIIEF